MIELIKCLHRTMLIDALPFGREIVFTRVLCHSRSSMTDSYRLNRWYARLCSFFRWRCAGAAQTTSQAFKKSLEPTHPQMCPQIREQVFLHDNFLTLFGQ